MLIQESRELPKVSHHQKVLSNPIKIEKMKDYIVVQCVLKALFSLIERE